MRHNPLILATILGLGTITVLGSELQGENEQPGTIEVLPVVPQPCLTNDANGGTCEVFDKYSLIKVLEVSQTFQRNQAAADENFTKKKLAYSGRLVRIVRAEDAEGKPYYSAEISPDGKPAKNFALAFLFKLDERKQLRCLTVGDHVRIQGECIGVVTEDPAPPVPGLPPAPPRAEIQFIKCKVLQ